MNNQMCAFCFPGHFQAMNKGLIFGDIVRRGPYEIKMGCERVPFLVFQDYPDSAVSGVSSRGSVRIRQNHHATTELFAISSETRILPQCSQVMTFEFFLSSRIV